MLQSVSSGFVPIRFETFRQKTSPDLTVTAGKASKATATGEGVRLSPGTQRAMPEARGSPLTVSSTRTSNPAPPTLPFFNPIRGTGASPASWLDGGGAMASPDILPTEAPKEPI